MRWAFFLAPSVAVASPLACGNDNLPPPEGFGESASPSAGDGESSGAAPVGGRRAPERVDTSVTDDPGNGPPLVDTGIEKLIIRRKETGELFDALGRPVEATTGEGGSPTTHTGESLEPLPGYNQFWFAWSVFNHGSEIFGQDHLVDTAALEGDGDCAVPCDEIRPGCPGKDCIPALTAPTFVKPMDAEAAYLDENSFVVGVAINGDARAYPHNILWWHEIVNDEVGGVPIAVTHCPLTWSSLGHDPTAFLSGETVELGVSGKLFNSNLVFYNRADDTYFSQLLGKGTVGAGLNEPTPRTHVWEMTWSAWKALHPDTLVISDDTGHARDYTRYPYGTYFENHRDTFAPTTPSPDSTYENKELTYGLRIGGFAKAYVHNELARWAAEFYGEGSRQGVLMDQLGNQEVAIVFNLDATYVQAFDATGLGPLEITSN